MMAVNTVPVSARMQMRLNTGLDEHFDPIYRTRSYSNVKTGTGNEDLFTLAQEMGSLQVHELTAVLRVDEVELEEVL